MLAIITELRVISVLSKKPPQTSVFPIKVFAENNMVIFVESAVAPRCRSAQLPDGARNYCCMLRRVIATCSFIVFLLYCAVHMGMDSELVSGQ